MLSTRALSVAFFLVAGVVACSSSPERPDVEEAEVGVEPGAVTPLAKPCRRTTCRKAGATCGTIPDGCGGILTCGVCPAPLSCGGGGVPNACGDNTCTPTTCQQAGATCGTIGDGCGGALNCGACLAPATCGGGGVPNHCGQPG
jgi:hypothetical protein